MFAFIRYVGEKVGGITDTLESTETALNMIEEEVCLEQDVKEGELKQVNFGSGKVLLSKYEQKIYAVSGKCTHYGAPLITGAYKDGKVRCPWHGACFSTVTGDIEDFPGLDSLHKYEVIIRSGKVFVKGDEKTLTDFRCVKDMENKCDFNEIILVIGGGSSAMTFCETLRKDGYKGKITIATKENHLPYDRPKLSKALNTEASKLYLRTLDFLKERNIEIRFKKQATSVDIKNQIVKFSDGTTEKYNKLFIATGGRPKSLTIPGRDLNNILYLRSPEDANAIDKACPDKDVVIFGTGFISLELAANVVGKCKSVTVVGSGSKKLPFEKLLGQKVANMYYKQHMDKGVKFCLDHPAKEIKGDGKKVLGVVLENGHVLPADVVLVGIGVEPSTEFLQDTNVKLDSNGYVIVDKFMKTSVMNVYAGGDIVSFPYCYDGDKMINIGHWQLSASHGQCAAKNILCQPTPCTTVPFFWTGQYGKALRYSGYCAEYDEIIYEGNVDEMKFSAYYYKNGRMCAVACMNMGARASAMAFLIKEEITPSVAELVKQFS